MNAGEIKRYDNGSGIMSEKKTVYMPPESMPDKEPAAISLARKFNAVALPEPLFISPDMRYMFPAMSKACAKGARVVKTSAITEKHSKEPIGIFLFR